MNEHEATREFFRERRWKKYEDNKRKLNHVGIPFTEAGNGILKVGPFDFYGTKGTFIHRKKRYTGRGIKALTDAYKKEEAQNNG